ncbi:cAMP-dependent protein kinase pathway protein [Macrophomina phaseolina MS6]|uniref:cAMP-dependent protein kinase pathway protein n=1 Tax=Macrophomina phaseolina (strain MS6) TaxID=1126212 RepID=K2S6Z5_MACPH|nr:cAMP-dependent protein kinase pathway protein [Macrophomina phaseolina MS6]
MMNQQQANMAAMNQQGGPVGGTPLMQAGGARGSNDPQTMLNTYIYDYFLKNHHWDLARQVKDVLIINTGTAPKPSPGGRRDMNGVDDMDTDSKDELHKRPDDLPPAAVPSDPSENSFLFDWWTQFWDIFNAQRQRSKPGSAQLQYLAHTRQQAQLRQENQQRLMMTNNAPQYRNMMGMPANAKEMQMRMMQNRGAMNPQQLQQMKSQQQIMQNQQMQRDGSQMDMNQRPQSPGSAENAPSPNKRPRLENGFNGQQMGPGARSQGMQPQQMGATSAAQAGQLLMANGIDPNNMTPQQFSAFQGQNPNVQAKGLQEMNNAGMQNSPMAQQGADGSQDFFQGNANARMQPGAPGQQPGGNHALQDYQMQLMLLEQQNKKRLLMARQEQDNITQHPASGPVGQPGFPPAMSPQGSRAGPSPNPSDQMKRGTPKLNQAGLPGSPMPDGSMPQNRNSPLPNGFDPNQMPPGMPPQFYQGQMGANGMMRPPSSHPGFQGQMTQQQMEMIARNGGRMPNGMWPQGGPQMMQQGQQQQGPPQAQGMQQGQPQQPPMGTPQQRNQQMPPPPAPAPGNENGRTQPSSPAQPQNQPPTPSQANKPNPKNKKKDDKKGPPAKPQNVAANKKGSTTGATPASDAENPPPTPTPSTPSAPMQQKKSISNPSATAQQPNPQQQPPAPANQPPQVPAQPPMDPNANAPFGDLGNDNNGGFNLDFGSMDSGDVLENFDFDTFLHTDDGGSSAFTFDQAFLGDGVEADAL